ncbi:15849_t:CDS:2 [Cetraspora pellucida]|uniref:15849_t:CDS:1 n=1 Tax=Cetraspora pellucida TaxID=1433469 RepID=A0A9N9GT72_9GLOM|nr:15849_t:CDS:2 [Cetraspora pellucida]
MDIDSKKRKIDIDRESRKIVIDSKKRKMDINSMLFFEVTKEKFKEKNNTSFTNSE